MTDCLASPPGAVIWITGLSGAGKSSVARELVVRLLSAGCRPILLDGDEMRAALGATDAYNAEARLQLSLSYARLCQLLSSQGHTIVCATISLRHEVYSWNRANLPRYIEVLLDVPLTELKRRNPKGVYRSCAAGIVGVDIIAEFPPAPDLIVSNFGQVSVPRAAARIFQFCATRGAW
jgi:adenylylsulfate kinase